MSVRKGGRGSLGCSELREALKDVALVFVFFGRRGSLLLFSFFFFG